MPPGTMAQVWLYDYDNTTCTWEKSDAFITGIQEDVTQEIEDINKMVAAARATVEDPRFTSEIRYEQTGQKPREEVKVVVARRAPRREAAAPAPAAVVQPAAPQPHPDVVEIIRGDRRELGKFEPKDKQP